MTFRDHNLDAKRPTLIMIRASKIIWPPHAKSWLIGKDSDAGRDWGQEEKGTTEYEMAGWHHWLNGRESQWTPGVGDGQGGLACCNSWGRKESDMTERLIWSESLSNWQTMTAQFLTSILYTSPLVAECLFSDLVRSEEIRQSNT